LLRLPPRTLPYPTPAQPVSVLARVRGSAGCGPAPTGDKMDARTSQLVVFDLDETLDHPIIAKMLLALHRTLGFRVAVLSGGLTSTEHKRRQLRYLGIPDDVPLSVIASKDRAVVASGKAKWLSENKANLFVENDHLFSAKAHAQNPHMIVLQVLGPRSERSSYKVK